MKQALQFSGGKDSLACLYLLRDEWPETVVVWLNTGAAFPESLELMERVKKMVPHFLEVRTDVAADIQQSGWPTDLVATQNTSLGKLSRLDATGVTVRSWSECCARNLWFPLHQATLKTGAKTIIRGQRITEDYKSPVRDGNVIDGITYRMPLQDWTEEQVKAYLAEQEIGVPDYYEDTTTSLDCWLCTAFLDAKIGQINFMKAKHPDKYAFVRGRLQEILQTIRAPLHDLEQAIG